MKLRCECEKCKQLFNLDIDNSKKGEIAQDYLKDKLTCSKCK